MNKHFLLADWTNGRPFSNLKEKVLHGSPARRKVWQKSHELVLELYQITASFPRSEAYGLTPQIRRAAVSMPSNIAERCGRYGDAELARFQHTLEIKRMLTVFVRKLTTES